MMRMLLYACMVTAVCALVLDSSAHAQASRVSYIEYKFDNLDEKTRTAITRFNSQLSKFSEGCIAEQDKVTYSFLSIFAADSTCGIAALNALKSKTPLATTLAASTAAIACGIQIPQTLRDRAEKKENLKTCKELDDMIVKYKKFCENKTRVVFAFDDAIYCYSPVDGLSLLVLDMKNRTVLIKKP